MIFNKDSKIVRISACAEGYYSGATAYGELYIPIDFYEEHKDVLKDLEIYVGELDGKHSESECSVEFDTLTITDILRMENTPYEQDRNLDNTVVEDVVYSLKLQDAELNRNAIKILKGFHNELLCLEKFYLIDDISFNLSQDTIIEGNLVPQGTKISYTIESTKKIPEDWNWEYHYID